MKKLKTIFNQIKTGSKNNFGLRGYSAGNYPLAVSILKHK